MSAVPNPIPASPAPVPVKPAVVPYEPKRGGQWKGLFGLVLIRMTSWETGLRLQASLLGLGSGEGSALGSVPLPVIALMLAGLAGHFGACLPGLSAWLQRPGRSQNLALGAGYAASVVLMVAFGPGVSKSFIYIAF